MKNRRQLAGKCFTAIATLAGVLCVSLAQATAPPEPLPMPRIAVMSEGGYEPVRLGRVQVETELVGGQARTRIEFGIFNPNDRVLEGELQFPLRDGQVVTGFALDIDGELRPAVAVEKVTARRVFEDVIRQRIDPALLEAAGGNNYKLRVYPLPAQGTRRVVLDIAETLTATNGAYHYRLPLAYPGTVDALDVRVKVAAVRARALAASLGAEVLQARDIRPDSEIRLQRQQYAQQALLQVSLPADDSLRYSTGLYQGEQYFYAELPAPKLKAQPRKTPQKVALIWDASASAAQRDRGRELALLDAWFAGLRDHTVEVRVQVVRDVAQPEKTFTVSAGNWKTLRDYLEQQPLDGATSLAAMQVPAGVDLALLFSDGMTNYGARRPPEEFVSHRGVPLYTVNSAIKANAAWLRAQAEVTGGAYLDLAALSLEQAARELDQVSPWLADMQAVGAEQLVLASRRAHDDRVQLAGVLKTTDARVTLIWRDGNGREVKQQHRLAAAAGQAPAGLPLAAWRWASLRLAELGQGAARQRGEILRVAKRFGLVSSETSLLVLDRVEDYARHEIEPPASLLPRYRELLAKMQQEQKETEAHRIELMVAWFEDYLDWWNREFPKTPRPVEEARQSEAQAEEDVDWELVGAPAEEAPPARQRSTAAREEVAVAVPVQAAPQAAAGSADSQASAPTARIYLQRWKPDAPYVQRFEQIGDGDLYAAYVDEKPSWQQSTAFFLDASDMLLWREPPAPELALRVLSNLAEMDLENRHILRLLAYRLLQQKRFDLALPVFEQVRDLAPEEPQSWRDLALAHQAAGNYRQALDAFWKVVSGDWHGRFQDIGLTALIELNALVSEAERQGVALDLDAIDPRLLKPTPLDMRVVLNWDADNTDIDLMVIDPDGEKTWYGHTLSWQGGRLSQDYTGGYGPEVFDLRDAKPGTYTVMANFYGHRQQLLAPDTTLMLRLITDFGRADEKSEDVMLRVKSPGQEIVVGRFEVE